MEVDFFNQKPCIPSWPCTLQFDILFSVVLSKSGVGMFSRHSFPIVDRIFFRCFGKSCFVCIVLPFVDISLIFFLWSALLVYILKLNCYFFCVACSFFPPLISAPLFFIILAGFRSFFICLSSQISHPDFDCFFVLFEGIPIFSQTNFAPA